MVASQILGSTTWDAMILHSLSPTWQISLTAAAAPEHAC